MKATGKPPNSILVVDARVPTPDLDSGSLRMFRLLTILKSLSWDVSFIGSHLSSWPPMDSRLEGDTDSLQTAGVRVVSRPTVDSVEDHLRQEGWTYDVVMLSGVHVAAQHLAAVRLHAPLAKVLFDTVDLHHLREFREARLTGNAHRLKRALQLRDAELAIVARTEATLVVSPEEKRVLENGCPGARLHVVSNIHEADRTSRPFSQREGLLFVGGYQHSPNVDGAIYFAREILPLIQGELPGVKSYLLGGNPPLQIVELASEELLVPGYVPDLRPYFDRCRLSVAPLRFGAGVKGKVLTSLGYGVPVVASSLAAEGMGLAHGREILIADDPRAFAGAVVELYHNEQLWDRLSANGLAAVARDFSFDEVRGKVSDLLDQIRARSAREGVTSRG